MAKRKPLLDAAAQAFIRGEGAAAVAAKPEPLKVAPAAPPATSPGQAATIRFTLDMDPEQHRRLRVAAADRGVRMSAIVREALDQWFSNG